MMFTGAPFEAAIAVHSGPCNEKYTDEFASDRLGNYFFEQSRHFPVGYGDQFDQHLLNARRRQQENEPAGSMYALMTESVSHTRR